MQDFIPGQRWISGTESQLGLGTVLRVEGRTVTIVFPASGETRTYSRQTAPLTRVRFAPGDTVLAHDGRGLRVQSVHEHDGLLSYRGVDEDGQPMQLEEGELSDFLQLNRPGERLFSGQIDADRWFELRYRTLEEQHRLAHSDLYGLIGGRTDLVPHQLYIAHEVANRYAPRVLLADEVGLGKTIEAGLILHQQLLTGRASRALIVVPDSLLYQWLVEMLRRFNLRFSIFDETRCSASEQESGGLNPFHSEQLILCRLDFLVSEPGRLEQAVAGDWDLLVVDEAHHLRWSPEQASPEYRAVERLAAVTAGVLLLTATPEQLGKASHFARLRLLDPDRFPDYAAFLEEEKRYQPVARVIGELLEGRPLERPDWELLQETVDEGDNRQLIATLQDPASDEEARQQAREALVEHLLDRHGTGRVLFRNTRAAVRGFPQRRLHPHALPLPDAYRPDPGDTATQTAEPQELLSPETGYRRRATADEPAWWQLDPRVDWLHQLLLDLKPHKVLLIAASADTVLELAAALRTRHGLHAAVFHEGMSIVERDRAAAFFADRERGSQVLLCSEIGSEGRNFQFAQHLVLFDLPFNPDLLEQRIGRLDRIGQRDTIHIHLPWMEHSAQAVMYRWYHEGLQAFEHTCPAGHSVFDRQRPALEEALGRPQGDLDHLIESTRRLYRELSEALQQGRDRLLEYNSCRPRIANRLCERARHEDRISTLPDYLERVFDCFDIDIDPHSRDCHIVRPGAHMLSRFPELPDDGMTVTWRRETALANEDVQFLSWEHPLVNAAMDRVLASERGNAALCAVEYAACRPGTLLLECVYVLEAPAGSDLQASRYLPPTSIRVLIDEQGRSHADKLSHAAIAGARQSVDVDTAIKVVRARDEVLRKLLADCEQQARRQAPARLATAHARSERALNREIERLRALARVNPNVRAEEIRFFERQRELLRQAIEHAGLRLDALRVLVTT